MSLFPHLILMFALFALSSCNHPEAETVEFKKASEDTIEVRDVSHVSIAKMELKNFPKTIEIPGRVVIADKDVTLISARVSGRIETVSVAAGDMIEKGAVLLRIWSPDLATAVQELESAKKQNNRELLSLTFEKLASMGLDPHDIHKESQTAFAIRSPIRGAVLEKKVTNGSNVNAGDQMLTVGKVDSYQFAGEILPELAVNIKPGMKVLFPENPDIQAKVDSISVVPDSVSRLVKVRCRFTQGLPKGVVAETLLKGQVVIREELELVAPSKALIRTADKEFIFVRDLAKPTLFKRVAVTVEDRQAVEMALQTNKDLGPNREVVAEGALLLNNILEGDE